MIRLWVLDYQLAEMLKNMGYSYQKARFVSDHLDDVAAEQKEWMEKRWPEFLHYHSAPAPVLLA
jgi:hypothetical protein